MIILDTLLVGGIKFVLRKLVDAVEAQLNDDSVLREELLAAQMRYELGEMNDAEFATFEDHVLSRLREIRDREREKAGGAGSISFQPGAFDVDVSFTADHTYGDEHDEEEEP